MQCSKETIARLFYNVSSSFLLFFLSSILLLKILHFLGGNIFFQRNQGAYEFATFSDEEVEDENEYDSYNHSVHVESNRFEEEYEEEEIESVANEESSIYTSPVEESGDDKIRYQEDTTPSHYEEEKILTNNGFDCDYSNSHENNIAGPTLSVVEENLKRHILDMPPNNETRTENVSKEMMSKDKKVVESNFMKEGEESKKLQNIQENKEENDEIFGDSCTVGSTSKSSSEWRSSIKDSCTDDPFSSSSRRSCPKWESYTIFQKYDEEMLFLDRITARKLHETESLRSIQTNPRSISDRIVYKFAPKKERKVDFLHNPFHELEGAYVAQICLTWEALNWNYKYFQRLKASSSRHDSDHGCPAYIAQQFQQFQVLLQRYIETEPFERGRRPEVYARVRRIAPKLLQVPEYRDSDEEKREEGFCTRIPSNLFLKMMEESIRTFMNFLKADKESHCQIIASFFKKNRGGSFDPALLLHLKKQNKKKKSKLKEIRKSGKCLRKRRLKEAEEMEILMAEIDLKVVSRVLRMKEVNGEQLHWCEDKMGKVKISDSGKLHRDSSPLFFPAH